MSKDVPIVPGESTISSPMISYLHEWQFRDFEGKLLTLIETIGLKESQENAIKSYARQLVWGLREDSYIIPVSIRDQIFTSREVEAIKYANRPVMSDSDVSPMDLKKKR